MASTELQAWGLADKTQHHNIAQVLSWHHDDHHKAASVSLGETKMCMQEPQACLQRIEYGRRLSFLHFSECRLPWWMLSQLPCTAAASVVFSLLMRRLHSDGRFVKVLRNPYICTAQCLHIHSQGPALSPLCLLHASSSCRYIIPDLDPNSLCRALKALSEESNMWTGLDQT